jgi:low temperature requirement protein LtrA
VTDGRVGAGTAESVRPLELFFDLVFVFTITQAVFVLDAYPASVRSVRML